MNGTAGLALYARQKRQKTYPPKARGQIQATALRARFKEALTMTTLNAFPLAAFLLLSFAGPALAQTAPHSASSPGQRQGGLKQDWWEARDDRQDLRRLQALLAKMDRARSRGDRYQLERVDSELRAIMEEEYSEARLEEIRAHDEVRQDRN